jgi:hypothetical protein
MSLSIAHSSSSKTPNIASPEVVSIPNISEAVEEITPPELDAGTLKQFPADPPNYSAEREIDDGCPQICLTDTIDVTPSSSSYVSTSAIKSPNHTPQYPPTTKNNDHLSRPVQILNNSSAHDLKGKRSFESRNCNDSNDQSTKEPSKKLPKRTECELDSTSFKMSDLIRWKPKSENTLRTKVNIKKKQLRQSLNGITSQPPASEQPETIGPRVIFL